MKLKIDRFVKQNCLSRRRLFYLSETKLDISFLIRFKRRVFLKDFTFFLKQRSLKKNEK